MAFCQRSVNRRIPTQGWMTLVLLCLCRWLGSDGTYSPLQVQVAPPMLRAAWEPPRLDAQKLKACDPKLLETDQLKALIAEARDPKRAPRGKPKPRTSTEKPGLWRCSACDQWLPETAFHLEHRCGGQLPSAYCKRCSNERRRLHHRTLRGSLLHLLRGARPRAKGKPWNVTLTFEDLLEMVEQQNGRCAYSGVPMEMLLPNSHWRMSLERLNNSEGYSRENCVLIACEFNTGDCSQHRGVDAKTVEGSGQWSLWKVRAVFQLRHQPLDSESLAKDITEARLRHRLERRQLFQHSRRDGRASMASRIYCSACDMFLAPGNFTPSQLSHGKYCRACWRRYSRARRSTLRGHMQKCLGHAKSSAKKRGQEFSLTLSQVLDMLEHQCGRCFYSGVPLEYKRIHAPWRLSIERLNNSIGYTVENCVLIAIEFNTSDHSRNNAVTEVFGTAQWSREKVEHAWGDKGWASQGALLTLACKEAA